MITDCFALLEEPRRPWLDQQLLKQKFLTLSAQVHPDRVHNASDAEKRAAQDRYTQLNTAYNCLRDPKDRLRHLIELELGSRPKQVENIPSDALNLFVEVGQACRGADQILAQKSAITSPLLKIALFERGQDCSTRLGALQQKLKTVQDQLLVALKQIDARWDLAESSDPPNRKVVLGRLEEIYRLTSFLDRWSQQIQDRIVRLSL